MGRCNLVLPYGSGDTDAILSLSSFSPFHSPPGSSPSPASLLTLFLLTFPFCYSSYSFSSPPSLCPLSPLLSPICLHLTIVSSRLAPPFFSFIPHLSPRLLISLLLTSPPAPFPSTPPEGDGSFSEGLRCSMMRFHYHGYRCQSSPPL